MNTKIKTMQSGRKADATLRRTQLAEAGMRANGMTEKASFPRSLRIKSILVPIDFSACSKKALAYAVAFAEQFGAKLTLLHVVEPVATPDFAKSFPLLMENDKAMAAAKGRLEHTIKEQEIDPKLVEKTVVDYGRSFELIVDSARMLNVDLIIISTHGYTGLKHVLMGSTTE